MGKAHPILVDFDQHEMREPIDPEVEPRSGRLRLGDVRGGREHATTALVVAVDPDTLIVGTCAALIDPPYAAPYYR